MSKKNALLVSLALSLTPLAALPAAADTFDAEARSQHERIDRGIRNGSLTYREAAVLREEQGRIRHLIARARQDGRVDPYERREIEQAQNVASQHIYREKHDVESRPRRWGWWHRDYSEGRRHWQ
jgi:Spy/CpxP family protein refolding chaperone